MDGIQREVADFLISYGKPGVLISQKCQEDPWNPLDRRNKNVSDRSCH
jgi:hypothetical protein